MRTVKPKVYLVVSGEYSDYQVLGAFLSREQAESAVLRLTSEPPTAGRYSDGPSIEEFTVGEIELLTGFYLVRSKTHSIEVELATPTEGGEYDSNRQLMMINHVDRARWAYGVEKGGWHYRVVVCADDAKHATKIAADLFRARHAMGFHEEQP